MKVFIYRHAAAEPGDPDEDRFLSEVGREQVGDLAGFVPEAEFEEVWKYGIVRLFVHSRL